MQDGKPSWKKARNSTAARAGPQPAQVSSSAVTAPSVEEPTSPAILLDRKLSAQFESPRDQVQRSKLSGERAKKAKAVGAGRLTARGAGRAVRAPSLETPFAAPTKPGWRPSTNLQNGEDEGRVSEITPKKSKCTKTDLACAPNVRSVLPAVTGPTLEVATIKPRTGIDHPGSCAFVNVPVRSTPRDGRAREMLQQHLQSILKDIRACEFAEMLLEPVDPALAGAPDYYERIKNPMDLKTMQTRLDIGFHVAKEIFAADLRRMLENAKMYNGEGHYCT